MVARVYRHDKHGENSHAWPGNVARDHRALSVKSGIPFSFGMDRYQRDARDDIGYARSVHRSVEVSPRGKRRREGRQGGFEWGKNASLAHQRARDFTMGV